MRQTVVTVSKCISGHHFLGQQCPWCGKSKVGAMPYKAGDCIACSALCQDGLFCCNRPRPLHL